MWCQCRSWLFSSEQPLSVRVRSTSLFSLILHSLCCNDPVKYLMSAFYDIDWALVVVWCLEYNKSHLILSPSMPGLALNIKQWVYHYLSRHVLDHRALGPVLAPHHPPPTRSGTFPRRKVETGAILGTYRMTWNNN